MWACPHGSRTTRSDRSRINLPVGIYITLMTGVGLEPTRLTSMSACPSWQSQDEDGRSNQNQLDSPLCRHVPHANARRGYGGGKRLGLRWCGMSENQQQLGGRSISCGVSLGGESIGNSIHSLTSYQPPIIMPRSIRGSWG